MIHYSLLRAPSFKLVIFWIIAVIKWLTLNIPVVDKKC